MSNITHLYVSDFSLTAPVEELKQYVTEFNQQREALGLDGISEVMDDEDSGEVVFYNYHTNPATALVATVVPDSIQLIGKPIAEFDRSFYEEGACSEIWLRFIIQLCKKFGGTAIGLYFTAGGGEIYGVKVVNGKEEMVSVVLQNQDSGG